MPTFLISFLYFSTILPNKLRIAHIFLFVGAFVNESCYFCICLHDRKVFVDFNSFVVKLVFCLRKMLFSKYLDIQIFLTSLCFREQYPFRWTVWISINHIDCLFYTSLSLIFIRGEVLSTLVLITIILSSWILLI